MPFLRRPFAPRRRVTLLKPMPAAAGIEPLYRAYSRRASVRPRSGSVRIEPESVEVVREHVEFLLRRFDGVDPGWFIRTESDGREYEVTFREPLGDSQSLLRLEAAYRPGRVARETFRATARAGLPSAAARAEVSSGG